MQTPDIQDSVRTDPDAGKITVSEWINRWLPGSLESPDGRMIMVVFVLTRLVVRGEVEPPTFGFQD